MTLIRFFSSEAFSAHKTKEILSKLKVVDSDVSQLSTEHCYHVELCEGSDYLNINQIKILKWLLSSPLQPYALRNETNYKSVQGNQIVIEIGPRYVVIYRGISKTRPLCFLPGILKKLTNRLHQGIASIIHQSM